MVSARTSEKKLMPVDFLQKQVAGRPSCGYLGPIRAIPTRWSFRAPGGGGDLQPKAEFAADSLQIAQRRISIQLLIASPQSELGLARGLALIRA
jgi:hypothetical protein